MEDLRDIKNKQTDNNNLEGRDVSTYLGHIPTLWDNIWSIKYLLLKIIFIGTFSVCLVLYPNEIGTMVGNWVYDFYSGLVNKF